ncbi:hypothetical protein [Maricaulis sp.]|uniref:hypothetical protein n=1 Tax=Maricaulis sp. TaxID=1486257 RepID=UPI002616A80A|nr:hypothetical protein [Maricaulis sp.]
MTETHQPTSGPRAGRVLRDVLAAVIAVATIALVFILAAMLTAVFLAILGAALIAGGAYWLWLKVRRRKSDDSPEVLVATRGPEGWTVDGLNGSKRRD